MNDLVAIRESLHHIRNQLSLITGYSSLMKESPNLSDRERKDIQSITTAAFVIRDHLMTIESLCATDAPPSP